MSKFKPLRATPARAVSQTTSRAASRPGWLGTTWESWELLAGAALTLWVIALHVVWLTHAGPLWRDEVGTIDFAAMPSWGEIWHNLQYDNFPPLFVALARAWLAAGLRSDLDCRLLGLGIGLLTLALFWGSARVLGMRAPLLVLGLYAANPLAIRFGDALRPYGLAIALTVLALVMMWRLVEKQRGKIVAGATLAAVLCVQCLYQSALLVAAFCGAAWLALLSKRQWKAAGPVAIVGVVAALSLLPHLPTILKGQQWFGISRRDVPFGAQWDLLSKALHGGAGWMVAAWLGLLAGAVAIALLSNWRRQAAILIYLGAVMAGAALIYWLFWRILGLALREWYFLILMAVEAVCIDAVFGTVSAPLARLGRIGLGLGLAASCIPVAYAGVTVRQTNIDLVAAELRTSVQPGDMVLISPWYYGVSLQRYLGTNGWTTLPPMSQITIHRYDLMKKQMEADQPIAPLLAGVEQALRAGHAVWVAGVFQFPPPGQPQPVLAPYRGELDMADTRYFSSWLFQISGLVQDHAVSGEEVKIPVPNGQQVSPLEDVPVYRFGGWR